ncbi:MULTISPECIES: hypothetical protein [unclassified Brevibacterium]|uniref:hypothetical protein n=1 Tax=unclassified Brevibacterium TaxID=2614124 RepID=UPI002E7BA4C8|nr:hypothetical protein [Brevibacterium sp. CCUG 69071]
MLLAIPYLLIANVCIELVEDGAPGWLHLIVLWAIWSMLKMLWIRPVSAVLLMRDCVRESVTARRERANLSSEAADAERRAAVDTIAVRWGVRTQAPTRRQPPARIVPPHAITANRTASLLTASRAAT